MPLCEESNAKLQVKGVVFIFTIQSTMAILRIINDGQHDGQYRAIVAVRMRRDVNVVKASVNASAIAPRNGRR